MDKNKLSEKINNLSQEEVWKIIARLPIPIQDLIYSADSAKINTEIFAEFELTEDQAQKLLNIFILLYDRQISLNELPEILEKELSLPKKIAKELALALAQKRFWEMQEYIGGVEKLIKSLGGELPKKIIKPITAEEPAKKTAPQSKETDKEQTTDNIIQQNIKTVLNENSNAQEQLITSENILLTNSGEIHKSSIKYWLMEYMQTLGAGYHSNLDRIGFLYNNPNAKKLSAEERQILGAVLKSYDDGDTLPFSETTGRLLIDKLKQ